MIIVLIGFDFLLDTCVSLNYTLGYTLTHKTETIESMSSSVDTVRDYEWKSSSPGDEEDAGFVPEDSP
jgi:hypothetical protein